MTDFLKNADQWLCGMFHSLACVHMVRFNGNVSLGGTPKLVYVALGLSGRVYIPIAPSMQQEALHREPALPSKS